MMDAPAPYARSPVGNTQARYGAVAKVFHWTIALGILVMIPLGIIANDLPYATSEELARKAALFSAHKTLGVLILLTAVLHIAWAVSQPKPGSLRPERRLETTLAETVHYLLYASLILVPLSGWVSHAASEGFAPIVWPLGQSLPFVPKSEALYRTASTLHLVLQRVLVLALLLHVAGALKHHLWDRDATLRRMLPGRTALPPIAPHRISLMPPLAAAGVVMATLAFGLTLGAAPPEARASETASLPPLAAPDAATVTASAWTVEEGTLGIAVSQLGAQVEGGFSDWAAAIAFDEAPDAEGLHGEVEVRVAIGSLTLGSVTTQALGAEFFDVEAFPHAVFSAPIRSAPEVSGADYVAEGTLALRGAEVPVTLPFTLALEGDRATMAGTATVDRRAFDIGEAYADAGTLGFEVEIAVALTATRAD